jgi:hypothetical protein
MTICRLCLQEKKLIKKSHIIPEFMYQELFDDNHKMFAFNPHKMVRGEGYMKRPSTGEYEGGILCADCDNKLLGGYEEYGSKVIYGGQLPTNEIMTYKTFTNHDGLQFTHIKNINYRKFKIFLLSILWRANISSRPMFNEISLGLQHSERIRKMIYEGNGGDVDDYPIYFMTYVNDKTIPTDLVAHPQKKRTRDGYVIFVFIIGGMVIVFYVYSSGHKPPDYILTQTIKPTNEMNLIHIPSGAAWDMISNYLGIEQKPSH